MSGVTKPIATDETLQRIAEALDAKDTTQNRIDEINAISEEKKQEIEIVGEQVKSTIPDDYSILTEKVNNASNALKGEASGAVVRVDDVSPVEHELGVKVRSKNLFNIDKINGSGYGLTLTKNADGTQTLSGTLTQTYNYTNQTNLFIPTGTTVTVSSYFECEKMVYAGLVLYDADGNILFHGNSMANGSSSTIILTKDVASVGYVWRVDTNSAAVGDTLTIDKIKMQLEIGDTASEYTPYVDPSTVKVIRSGKNMLINKKGDATIKTISWTVNEDGTINASGTMGASDISDYYFFGTTVENEDSFIAPCDLILSTNYEIDNNNVFGVRTSAGLLQATANGIVIPKGTRVDGVFLRVFDRTINQQYIECQMEIGTGKTAYEPCRWQSALADKDGTIKGVTSLAPTMTLLPDKAGITLELDYNKDVNKVIESLTNAIISLGGNI